MNVKADFLEWFIKRGTYPSLGETTMLKYINGYVDFLGFDPFDVVGDFSNVEVIKQKIISRTEELKDNQEYIAFQYKSSRNAPAAFLGKNNYFVFLDELKNQTKKGMLDIKAILNQPDIQLVIKEPQFFFQKGQDALKEWMNLAVSDELKNTLISLSKDYIKLQEEAAKRDDLKQVLELLFTIIAYCDKHAKDKNLYNQYDDKRILAFAFVRMNNWIEKLIQFKFLPEEVGAGSPQNAFNYLLDPENNVTILSENHRKLISENLINKSFNSFGFASDLIAFFYDYKIQVSNPKNYTEVLSRIIYKIENRWKEEVVALMASNGAGWQDAFIQKMKEYDAAIIWNSKRPSGTSETLNFLRTIIEEGDSFNLYYSIGGKVYYKATVIDFVENQKELDGKKWHTEYGKLFDYQSSFVDYTDNIKSANIVFLVKTLEKMEPIPVNEFKFYKNYKVPEQDNLSPIKTEPENLKVIESIPEIKQKDMTDPQYPLNQILFGPPGTGKTYNTVNKALEIIGEKTVGLSRKQVKELFDARMKEGQIVFTTFHQSMSYEDFIEGIKPVEPAEDDEFVSYKVEDGIFKQLCLKAQEKQQSNFDVAYKGLISNIFENENELIELKTPTGKPFYINVNSNKNLNLHTGKERKKQGTVTADNLEKHTKGFEVFRGWEGYANSIINNLKDEFSLQIKDNETTKNYVLIIDEINRGNIAQIFGELITLIEDDKRLGKDEALEVTLPYSKEKFGVPANLYIIGTMNTADRSVEALDTALRRRFSFIEMPPDSGLIKAIIKGIDLPVLLDTINKRIVKLLDKDHQIGHSFFMSVNNVVELKIAFHNKIVPLLQEYFFGDFGKAGLVLGEGFFELQEEQDDNLFADFNDYDASEFAVRPVYKVKDIVKMSDTNFINAIQTLLRK